MRRALFASTFAGLSILASAAAAQEDVGASREAICCGANCCLIGGECFTRGDTNPADDCQECDPSVSQTAWTDVDGCGGGSDAGPTDPPEVDAGSGGDTDPGDGGCSVGATGSAAPGAILALLAGLAFWRRRR
jgi:MYXO-CTERM domain-containing protein